MKRISKESGINDIAGYIYAMPHTIAVAIYNGLSGFEYGIAAEIFRLKRPELGRQWYNFKSCRVEKGKLRTSHGLEIEPEYGISDLVTADTVLVPGWRVPVEQPGAAFIEALQAAYKNGARLVSICTGSFALAHAGLLDGHRATTHWLHADSLRRLFPLVNVTADALYVRDGRISTSAGSAAGLDLCLAIVREDFGIAVANKVARRMVAPVHREGGQSQYAEPVILTTDDDDFGPILDWMTAHLEQPFTVEEVAAKFALSLRTFQRRFGQLTGISPYRWLNQQRVMRARGLLETTDLSIEEIAFKSGLGAAANLRKHFARLLGTTPSAYRSAFHANGIKG